MKKLFFFAVVVALLASMSFADTKAGWRLVWADEFTESQLADSVWNVLNWGPGVVNQELETYVPGHDQASSCVWVDSGMLYIEARHANNAYQSARITTQGKKQWTYGRFEARAKLPPGRGTWPAIWMMPTSSPYGGWPSCGEIDIMEEVGYDPNVIHYSLHCNKYNFTNNTQKTAIMTADSCFTKFHIYAMDWFADSIKGYVDDSCYFKFKNEHTGWQAWPWDNPFHWILNIAIGGSWGGAQGVDNTISPTRMIVDYLRVYQYDPNAPSHASEGRARGMEQSGLTLRRSGEKLTVGVSPASIVMASAATLDGRTVLRKQGTQGTATMDLSGLPRGTYVVTVSSSAAEYHARCVVGR